MTGKLNELAFGYGGAAVSAAGMLLLGLFGGMGMYMGAVSMMMQWHMFFGLSPLSIITGIIEAAIIGFIFSYGFAWLYNKFA